MEQVKTSRLLLTKMISGNKFESLEQVKNQLNGVLPDLIQNNCDAKKVPYLTDGDELGIR